MKLQTTTSATQPTSQGPDVPNGGRTTIKVLDGYVDVEEQGYALPEPVVHLFGRAGNEEKWPIEVDGFYPYFLVRRDALDPSTLTELDRDHRVREVELNCDDGMLNEELAKIYTVKPYHVRKLRDSFDEHWEADVNFIDRFFCDVDIRQCLAVPDDARDRRVNVDEIEAVENDEIAKVSPRICTFDIEVKQSTEGPSVVSEKGTELASQPITAITAYDNYSGLYCTWVLFNEQWDEGDWEAVESLSDDREALQSCTVYERENELLTSFVTWVDELDIDILTAWNLPFDGPYLVNRCLKEKDVFEIMQWSPTKDVGTMHGEGKWYNSDLKGKMLFDMLTGFKKTNHHELKSNSLSNVAATVLDDMDKLDVGDIDNAWRDDPKRFSEYNLRDVEATVGINDTVGIL